MERIFILTQFNSVSLSRHIAQTYRFDSYRRGFVQVLAAQQTFEGEAWYQGTADAVRQNESYIISPRFTDEYVLILAGDHLYRMDYRKMLAVHTESKADITLSVIPVNKENTGGFGILQTDNDGRITDFVEKPQAEEELQRLAVPEDTFTSRGIDPRGRQHIASMGIYIFNRALLEQVLSNESHVDFGVDIIAKRLHTHRVFAYFFDGYWEDIGTIQAFYQANIRLTDVSPRFNFYDERTPIYTHRRHLPSTKVNNSSVRSSILSEGSIIDDSEIDRSIVGIRTVISARTRVYQSILMGADFYETDEQKIQNQKASIPDIGLGRGCLIRGAIIDKNARIGEDSIIANTEQKSDFDGEDYFIRDGIVIIPKDGVIKPATVM